MGILALAALTACADTDDDDLDDAPLDTAAVGDTMPAGQQAARDADHEFLRMMSNHHEGLVRMGMTSMNRGSTPEVQADALRMHEKQAMERDSMVAMIERDYQEQHRATPVPKNAAQADSLSSMSGVEHDRAFYRMTIEHHREGIGMIDQHMPRFTKPTVRQMAEKMKADQQREIEEFERKLNAG